MVDIHNFDYQYRIAERQVLASNISARNKNLIVGYRDACTLHGVCGKVRLIRVFHVLPRCAAILGKDFETVTREDVERLVTNLMDGKRKPATIATYKSILRRFLGWVLRPTEFPRIKVQPPEIAWMTVHLKKRDEKRLQRTELLTPSDIEALLAVCHSPRDKALISMLWETGGRVSELGNLQLKHLTKHPHGFLLDVHGKTGHRNPLIISSAPALATWLAHHPGAHNIESPLWVHYQYRGKTSAIDYDTIRMLLKRHFLRANITKPYHPHLFRHSRATHVLAHGIMTDAQARVYFGWSPESNMIGRYAHLTDVDAHNALLRENHLLPVTPETEHLQVKACQRCKNMNVPTATHCTTCTLPLNAEVAYNETTQNEQLVLRLAKVLVEQGLMEQPVQEIHKSNLAGCGKSAEFGKERLAS